MIPILLAAALQAAAASPPDEGGATLAGQMEALQGQLSGMAGTLESIVDDLDAVEEGDTAGQAAAWTRTLTVHARELSWFRVEDPLLLSARLALDIAASEQIIDGQPDGSSASYSIGYDFTSTLRRSSGPDSPDDAGNGAEQRGDEPAPFCEGGELESGERTTDIDLPLIWERCLVLFDSDGPSGVAAVRYRLGNERVSLAIVAVAAAADSAETRDAMMGPARRMADAMAEALVASGPPPMPFQD